jgi:aspartate ammonia-lyase
MKSRVERDSLGKVNVPAGAYYGAHTQRSAENFPVSGLKAYPLFIDSYSMIKKAAAIANMALGMLERKIGNAIIKAANEILSGNLREHFIIDVYQAGAGTSFNMNTNEVIANRAAELLGGKKGNYTLVHPNDHVNMSQSTNDTYPSAMRISCLLMIKQLLPVLKKFESTLKRKSIEFSNAVKAGRTHLQDGPPITLGQEFSGYSEIVRKHYELISSSQKNLSEVGLGGTAVGTGINTHSGYGKLVIKNLAKLTGLKLKPAKNNFEAMQSMHPFTALSSDLKNFSVDLSKISDDIRLMASGPRTGFGEIILPAVQPGSSIMPGKINPSMAEMMNMVCCQVIGNDLTITTASAAGQLELNVMMPVILFNLLFSMEILKNGLKAFNEKCVSGIKADRKKCREYAEKTISIVTALNPIIGYSNSAEIAKEAVRTGKSIIDVIKEKKILDRKKLEQVLSAAGGLMKLTKPLPAVPQVNDSKESWTGRRINRF